jgi:Flp pilus assembly protein TadG
MKSHGLWHSLGRELRRFRACTRGASATEFAILVPVLGTLLTGTIDLAQFGNNGLVLYAAVRAGAAYAMGATGCDPTTTNCETPIINVVQQYAGSLGTSVTVTFPNQTSGTDPRFCNWDNATTPTTSPVACTSTCDSAQSQCPLHVYVTINAVWTLPSPIMAISILPPSLTRKLTVRVG